MGYIQANDGSARSPTRNDPLAYQTDRAVFAAAGFGVPLRPGGLVDTLLAPLAVRGSIVIVHNGTPDDLERRVQQERATNVVLKRDPTAT